MKKLLFLLLLLMVGSTVFGATYSYTVSGKVYDRFTLQTVGGASVSHTIVWGPGSRQTRTTTSASDGSYTLTYNNTLSQDPKGKSMSLTATLGSKKGCKPWQCAGYSESKWCPVDQILLDPMLRIRTNVSRWDIEGSLPDLDPVSVYWDVAIAPPPELQSYNVQLTFDPTIVLCNSVDPILPPSTLWTPIIDNVAGTIEVDASLFAPVPIGDVNVPTELFNINWEVINTELAVTTVKSEPTSEFVIINGGPPESYQAVINHSDHLVGELETCQPYLLLDSQTEWEKALESEWPEPSIRPILESEWEDYMDQWSDPGSETEGEPYPANEFRPAQLWVYEGGGGGGMDPEDAGLVMYWGSETDPTGDYATAFRYNYGLDPDLRNSRISITITAPQFGPSGQVNAVSFSIVDIAGLRRTWWWSVGPVPAPIQWNTPTQVTIDTSITGLSATTPTATGYNSAGGFNLAQAQNFDVDENFQWVFGMVPVPPPGKLTFVGMWNYWHNLLVTPKPPSGSANSKWFVKYSQPPEEIEEGLINGWDEISLYNHQPDPIMADDWECIDDRPITDIHWWGSFIGWTQPHLPPIVPSAFRIGIWTDVPDTDPNDPLNWSHPGELVWENECTTAVWNFAGYDVDPREGDPNKTENEACFQWAQFLSQDEWFRQEPMEVLPDGTVIPNVYWLSIAAVYPPGTDYADPNFYPWGWKTRPHHFNDDAVRIRQTEDGTWPPVIGSTVEMDDCDPVEWPAAISWDLSFELTTNEPAYEDDPIPGDITGPAGVPDGSVDLIDLAVVSLNWLRSVSP